MSWAQTGPILIDRGFGPEPLARTEAPAEAPPKLPVDLPRLGTMAESRGLGWFWPERRWYWFEVWEPRERVFVRESVRLTAGEAEEAYLDLREAFWNAAVYRWFWTGREWKKDR